MMQYERKYGFYTDHNKAFDSIAAIEMVLKYAPLLFDFQHFDVLQNLLKNCRRIEKDTSENFGDKLAEAQARMWDNHRLWDHVERNPDTRQDELRRILGGNQDQWRSVAEEWETMGLLRRTPEGGSCRLALVTSMEELVRGKCPSCGNVVEASKALLLEQLPCPKCRVTGLFVILPTESDAMRRACS
jgi:predicted RNA-binding Zn-ribbon protein involved in translation (DUF1610 family)